MQIFNVHKSSEQDLNDRSTIWQPTGTLLSAMYVKGVLPCRLYCSASWGTSRKKSSITTRPHCPTVADYYIYLTYCRRHCPGGIASRNRGLQCKQTNSENYSKAEIREGRTRKPFSKYVTVWPKSASGLQQWQQRWRSEAAHHAATSLATNMHSTRLACSADPRCKPRMPVQKKYSDTWDQVLT